MQPEQNSNPSEPNQPQVVPTRSPLTMEPIKPGSTQSPPAPVYNQDPQLTPSPIPITPRSDNRPPATPPPPKRPSWIKRRFSHFSSMFSTLLLFLLAPVIALSIAAFVVQSYQVDGQSMETTLQNQDRLIVDKWPRTWARITNHTYIPKRGNIIIFNQQGVALGGGADKQLIKRVIGLPGEHVVVNNNVITIYNKEHPSGFNPDKVGIYHIAAPITPGNVDLTLHSDEIFVCGDNRTNSEDSRYFGPVNSSQIVGKLAFRIIPLDKAEKF